MSRPLRSEECGLFAAHQQLEWLAREYPSRLRGVASDRLQRDRFQLLTGGNGGVRSKFAFRGNLSRAVLISDVTQFDNLYEDAGRFVVEKITNRAVITYDFRGLTRTLREIV